MKYVLGIETSCDETSVALVGETGRVLDQITSTQIEVHRPFHGVVPEIAARHHLINLPVLYESIWKKTGLTLSDVDLISVTRGPGLIAALLVGVAFSRSLALSSGIPLLGINHLEGHLFSPFIEKNRPESFLGLVVSGSHASVYLVRGNTIQRLNGTRDDAPGEAFDKVAKLMKLSYPGGPVIDRLSGSGDPEAFRFKNPIMSDGSLDFSFSGIKSAVSRIVDREGDSLFQDGNLTQRGLDLLASFQNAVVNHLWDRVRKLWETYPVECIAVSGGVAANSRLQSVLQAWAAERGVNLALPPLKYITDNAAMIAHHAFHLRKAGCGFDDPVLFDADPRLGQYA
ncbi:MAG TPA: tRNA (adenosine(37)-N6)-threonylcarbamoyltransferase complex transferase subunit TsaD [Thermoanaerobaculia bacterium]|nr:tRNA (adenosine(37)-N6)-threonylcarbamoyltransferase complex transferase subunit TsaD [Thermoanaerobaculia bacterium]HUM28885.1 tRNA (adenosine(37)-N6)-threonylcarbamoyltransferase complex transferase subunit TsaD [Thermoanaerobaculia bacterium]HXK67182.1 tRNA (adenosine(37)-N6)-threonylcarbamoyltransferase complex transferase subunit TsaD [Thermoanaerobaculia bacterium]